MSTEVVSHVYSDSQDPIKVGDLISVDATHFGRVENVFMKGTKEAKDCGCEDTGVLSLTLAGLPVLMPFGCKAIIRKR